VVKELRGVVPLHDHHPDLRASIAERNSRVLEKAVDRGGRLAEMGGD
jgi:hypothetical protein